MFENQTFEEIMERMLDQVPDDIDKRENSVIWNALAPAAAELAQSYIWMDRLLELVFAETSEGEWLEKRTKELGVSRKPATPAVRRASFNIPVELGERFFIEDLYFVVTEGGEQPRLTCETPGTIGNSQLAGEPLTPINNIANLEVATMGDVLIPGEDEETDESLYQRYEVRASHESENGNRAQYKEWAEAVEGVGKAKVYPCWDGDGTVKIVIVNSEMEPASDELVQEVKDYIDPNPKHGEGVAPIGPTLTVESGVFKYIDLSVTVWLADGKKEEDAKQEIEQAVSAEFKEIAFVYDLVRKSQINNIVFSRDSVFDYRDLLMNGVDGNLELEENEVPKLRTVTLHVEY